MNARFTFDAELWEWNTESSPWVFVSLPAGIADEVDELVAEPGGFGSVKVAVEVGATSWRTSLFPDKSAGTFVLPIKRSVREAERLDVGDRTSVTITIVHTSKAHH